MPKRRSGSDLFPLASTLVVWVLLVAGFALLPMAASAAPLDGVTGPVNEITAPVQETIEQVVPPVSAPPPAPAPPPVQLPEVKVPDVPVKPPVEPPDAGGSVPTVPKVVETTTNTVQAATKKVTDAAGTVTTAGRGAENTRSAAGEVTGAAQKNIGSATAAAESVLNGPATVASAGTASPQGAPGSSADRRGSTAENGSALPTGGGGTPAAGDVPSMVFPGVPARFLRPFIRVWPAVALVTEGPLGNFVGHLSRSVLALFEENGAGSPRGGEEALTDLPPAAPSADQPPFSRFTAPDRTPFDWVADESAFVVLALLLVAGASTLVILALGRREIGLPMFRRGNRFPWRR